MAFNSFVFLVFLAVVLLLYYILPKKIRWLILLIASYTFYLYSGVEHVFYILGTTLLTYLAARLMQRIRERTQQKIDARGKEITREEKAALKKSSQRKVRLLQVASVLINLGVLAYVKYLNFFIGNLNELFTLFRWDVSMPLINIIVPLGLSYYTFNSIGYLVDVGRGKYAAERHLGKFALFVSFFPSIVQGPLCRYGDVGTQLRQEHKFEYNNLKYGAQLMLWGFFKKLVIADRLAAVTATIFSPSFADYSGSEIFFGVLAYSFQIYGDFSGGTDITRGVAQMFGINLPVNFARPFFATSMADFWRRWHMSLGAWMREYVFYPIMLCKPVAGLSKKFRQKYGAYAGKMVPSVAAPMVVFFLIGIWHGLTWQYIVNGLYNAILISAAVAFTPLFEKTVKVLRIRTETFSWRLFQMVRTFTLLCISRIIVKAPSLGEAWKMIRAMFTDFRFGFFTGIDGSIFKLGLTEQDMTLILVCIAVLLVVGILQERGMAIRETLAKQNLLFRWLIILALLFTVLIFGIYGPAYDASKFIYGGF